MSSNSLPLSGTSDPDRRQFIGRSRRKLFSRKLPGGLMARSALFALAGWLVAGCDKSSTQTVADSSAEVLKVPETSNAPPISEAPEASDLPDHGIVLRPIDQDGVLKKEEKRNHGRYALTAAFPGKLLIRVREPLLVDDPPAWAATSGKFELDGLAQQVIALNAEDLSGALEIEVEVEHLKGEGEPAPAEAPASTPDEAVCVHITIHRPGGTENYWHRLYQSRPIIRTGRSRWSTEDEDARVDSGSIHPIVNYAWGGNPNEIVGDAPPLTPDQMQALVVEVGWKSINDLTR